MCGKGGFTTALVDAVTQGNRKVCKGRADGWRNGDIFPSKVIGQGRIGLNQEGRTTGACLQQMFLLDS